jgi:hypothetical protein
MCLKVVPWRPNLGVRAIAPRIFLDAAVQIKQSRLSVAFNLKTGWLARGGRAGGFVPPTLPPWMRQEVGLWKRALPMCP